MRKIPLPQAIKEAGNIPSPRDMKLYGDLIGNGRICLLRESCRSFCRNKAFDEGSDKDTELVQKTATSLGESVPFGRGSVIYVPDDWGLPALLNANDPEDHEAQYGLSLDLWRYACKALKDLDKVVFKLAERAHNHTVPLYVFLDSTGAEAGYACAVIVPDNYWQREEGS